eukprot:m.186102 g.186102  ORF g.186102 m.186102 type:complete len:195 (-) comp25582_c0_seq2:27-611(-)
MIEPSKMDAIQMEYTGLLSAQLESQRQYFESRIAAAEKDGQEQLERIEQESSKLNSLCAPLEQQLQARRTELHAQQQLETKVADEFSSAMKNFATTKKEVKKLIALQEEWRQQAVKLQEQMAKLTAEQKERQEGLRQQIHDLKQHITASKEVSQASPEKKQELQAGHLVVVPSPDNGQNRGRGRGRKPKKTRNR